MAAVVSHEMRRFPAAPSDHVYSYGLRGEGSLCQPWSEEGESALSRSMRYADPWLYGSVRASSGGGLLLAPALVLCACPNYATGSRRSKKGYTTCKKCKGTRLPLDATRYGTMRCYPNSNQALATAAATPRAGTMRVTSSTRPSILPTADPYDLMRRSRLSVSESSSQFRARSASPRKAEGRSHSATRTKNKTAVPVSSPTGRRSILECNINPYELMSGSGENKDKSITRVNGQRIRVRPSSLDAHVYEDIKINSTNRNVTPEISKFPRKGDSNINKSRPSSPRLVEKHELKSSIEVKRELDTKKNEIKIDVEYKRNAEYNRNVEHKKIEIKRELELMKELDREKEHESRSEYELNKFKSILKKSKENESNALIEQLSPTPSPRSGSHFYIPTPGNGTPRKKVQFLVETEPNIQVQHENDEKEDKIKKEELSLESEDSVAPTEKADWDKNVCKLRRSVSERFNQDITRVVFHDTMALRTRSPRGDSRNAFTAKDLQRLDGLSLRKRKISPTKPRPRDPPPLPPNGKEIISASSASNIQGRSSNSNRMILVAMDKNDNSPENSITSGGYDIDIKTESDNSLDKLAIISKEICRGIISDQELDQKSRVRFLDFSIGENSSDWVKGDVSCEVTETILPVEVSPIAPCAPPRKRISGKEKHQFAKTTPILKIEPTSKDNSNKTVVQIRSSPTIHKLQIKNEFLELSNIQRIPVDDNTQRKTSILINGDDCYCTVNVNDDIPLYQSSVVVHDNSDDIIISYNNSPKKSSSVYITGNFQNNASFGQFNDSNEKAETENKIDSSNSSTEPNIILRSNIVNERTNGHNKIKCTNNPKTDVKKHPLETFNENNIPSSDLLRELLRDPVEAVRRNLVPHVCGKSDMIRRRGNRKSFKSNLLSSFLTKSSLEDNNIVLKSIEDSKKKHFEPIRDDCSDHSSASQYELMDAGSECYTDHSNRSSVTEEELAARTKFYEMLADSEAIEVDSEDHHYESIKPNNDPIYEEIEIPPPLPTCPPPTSLLDDLNLDKEFTTRSIFEGASKYDILSYLVDAKERGIVQEDGYTFNFNNPSISVEEDHKESYNRGCHLSSVSDSSEENSLIMTGPLDDKSSFQKTAEVERNDSGVGSETSKCSLSKYRIKQETSIHCEDCDSILESMNENEPLLCRKCVKKRSERKEIITEIVETEEKYSRDLQIILEEFYQPMLVAGLLTPEQLSAIFLNVEELLENSQALAERLRDAVEIATEQGDEDLLTVNIGKLFLEAAPMLHAFETYCVRQGGASLLLASLEKDKELLRIFLRVSQMENTLLRRMNLNSFLMVPVQRVTKYPLLLARLYKVTPTHYDIRETLKGAQHKIELHLNHMNSQTKDIPSKLWRRIGSSSGRRSSTEMDLVNIKLRKLAVDVLEWNHDEARFALEGKLLFTQPTDNNWRKGRTIKLTPVNALLVTNGKPITSRNEKNSVGEEAGGLTFSRHSGVRDAALLLVRDKGGRYSLLREPLYLDRCIIAADPAWQSYFEVQELIGKDTFIFKAEDDDQTRTWYRQLQHHAQGLGTWRKRRNALANIMINGMGLR